MIESLVDVAGDVKRWTNLSTAMGRSVPSVRRWNLETPQWE